VMNFGIELRSQRKVTIQGRCANNLKRGVRSDLVSLKPTDFAKLQGAGHAEQHNGNLAIFTDQRRTSECRAISVGDPPPHASHQIQYTLLFWSFFYDRTFLRKEIFALLRIGKSLSIQLDDVKIRW
jgi:hypothetical protein